MMATSILNADAELVLIQDLLGHGNVKTTQLYVWEETEPARDLLLLKYLLIHNFNWRASCYHVTMTSQRLADQNSLLLQAGGLSVDKKSVFTQDIMSTVIFYFTEDGAGDEQFDAHNESLHCNKGKARMALRASSDVTGTPSYDAHGRWCREPHIYRDVKDGDVFFLLMNWKDVANLEKYMRSTSGSVLLGAVDLLSKTARVRMGGDYPWGESKSWSISESWTEREIRAAAELLHGPHGNQTIRQWMEVVMKTIARVMLAVVTGIVFTVSAAFAGDPLFSGFLGSSSDYGQLTPGPRGGVKLRWVKPGVNFLRYNKFMVDSVIFYLADNADYKGIDPQVMKDMADSFNKELVAAFQGKYPIVDEPGPDVARIRFAITNIKPSKPGISAVTSIVPVGLAVSVAKKGVAGGWSGSGETGVELMVLDSSTNDVIAMAVDQQQAAFTSRFSKWGSATEAFKFWTERLVAYIDSVKGVDRDKP
jgi:hypothetical protein